MFGSNNNSLFGSSNPISAASGVKSAQNTGRFDAMNGQQPKQSFGSTSTSTFFGGIQQNNWLFGGNGFVGTTTIPYPIGKFTTVSVPNGTTIKFNARTGADKMLKNGLWEYINTRYQSITFMREYEYKSFEELRLKDYKDNRKGSQQTNAMFGNTYAFSSSNLFDTNSTPQNYSSSITNTTSLFNIGNTFPSIISQNNSNRMDSKSNNVLNDTNSDSMDCSRKMCKICLDKPINSALSQCGHVCMCYECATEQLRVKRLCPICRAIIRDVIRIYIS